LVEPSGKAPVSGCSLRAAYEGWDKMEPLKRSTQLEFSKGIDRFIELHGNLDVIQIDRKHVREFRDAAQLVPKHRAGKLRDASLPELVIGRESTPAPFALLRPRLTSGLTALERC
jgi:hypothetical protein